MSLLSCLLEQTGLGVGRGTEEQEGGKGFKKAGDKQASHRAVRIPEGFSSWWSWGWPQLGDNVSLSNL